MTNPAPTPTGRPPGRGWYAVALIVAIAGWTGMVLLLVARLSGSADRMIRVIVPGETELRLNEAGTYTIFHEHRSSFEGRSYHVEDLGDLAIVVRSRASGAVLPLKDSTSTRYTVGGRSGRSLYQFEAAAPGAYQISGTYAAGRREPQTILAIDRGFVGELLLTILGALAMAFGGTLLAIFVAVYVRRRRRAA